MPKGALSPAALDAERAGARRIQARWGIVRALVKARVPIGVAATLGTVIIGIFWAQS
jgi:hypothetical protein